MPTGDEQTAALLAEIAAQCERTPPTGAGRLVEGITTRYASAAAVILYGSCLRSQVLEEGVVDLYVLVDNYLDTYPERYLRLFNAWLPPNVFYLEASGIRVKYAVISLKDFEAGCERWFHSYLWSRFAQPVRLLYTRDQGVRDRIYRSLAGSVIKFLKTTVPAAGTDPVNAEAVWINGLSLSYAAELRPETRERARYITHQNLGDLIRLTCAAAPALADLLEVLGQGYYRNLAGERLVRRTRRHWRLRRWQGLVLSVLRLMKAAFTFQGGVDYAAWKIERHTGVIIPVTPWLQRHPILFGFSALWQLMRRKVL